MEALIQHNFISGAGDFLTDFAHYVDISHFLRNKGYNVHLRLCLDANKYINGPFLREIFTEDTLSIFSTIKEDLNKVFKQDNYEGIPYFGSGHQPQESGHHHFDLFIEDPPSDPIIKAPYSAARSYFNHEAPKFPFKFSDRILTAADNFNKKHPEEYCFMHVRTSDWPDPNNVRFDMLIHYILKHIEQTGESFHLGTNNPYVYKTLKRKKNIITYEYGSYDQVDNQMGSFRHNVHGYGHIEREVLMQRLVDTFAEMVTIQKHKKIYYAYDIGWISNFLYYPLYNAALSGTMPYVQGMRWLPRKTN